MSLECCPRTSKKAAFISVVLDGFEYHWYNRSDVYDNYGSRNGSTGGKWSDLSEDSCSLFSLPTYQQVRQCKILKKGRVRDIDSFVVISFSFSSGFWLWWKEMQPSLHFSINKVK